MIGRREFVAAGAAFAASGAMRARGVPQRGRIARIGHMTDTHVVGRPDSLARVKMALELFKSKGCEMVINNGDVADSHIPEAYRLYRKTAEEVYPDEATRPREVFAWAWHDQHAHQRSTKADPKDYMAAFENARKLIGAKDPVVCDFVWKGLPFIVMSEFTGSPGFPTWEEYEATVARVCAANPGKPVFVVDHVPPAGTTYHSWFWGNVNCRRVLNKFPQVVSLSGHVHGSLANERQIWQGEFTAINAGCLQVWDGYLPGSRTNRGNKRSYAVLVTDVYADRLVLYRYDVRDGAEVGQAWVVPLPFVAESAPFRPSERAKKFKIPAFAAMAALSVAARKKDGVDGCEVAIPESAADGIAPYSYRVRVQRREKDGAWKTVARDDLMAEWWRRPSERDGKLVHFLHAGFFSDGGAFRIAVTPMDFFYREGRPLFAAAPAIPALRTLWKSDSPMSEMHYFEGGKPLVPDAAGFVAPKTVHGQFRFPKGALKDAIRGGTNQFVVEMETEQNDGDWHSWSVTLRGGGCGNLSNFLTPVGKSGVLRYVMPFKLPDGKAFTGNCELSFFFRPEIRGNRFAIRRLALMA